ncbi:transaldolase, partial [Pelagibacterales bacterium SAG-MED07]|nr:transaldolase [Pelagibacterales bacterium SAG-MED07]
MSTKIFCDIADFDLIRKFNKKKIVKGFTTNPSLMRKAGAKNYETYSKKILKICKKKPISFEVFGDDHKNMMDQALKISTWGNNVFVKIPVVNSKGFFSIFSTLFNKTSNSSLLVSFILKTISSLF